MFYDRGLTQSSQTHSLITAAIGDFNTFEEFRSMFEMTIKNFWDVIDLNNDGSVNEIIFQNEIGISSEALLKVSQYLSDKLDYDGDEIFSTSDWGEAIGKDEENQYIGRRLISFPAPIFNVYTRLDEDRNDGINLQEITNFRRRTFALFDRNEDCNVNLKEILETLHINNLPKDFQLVLKQLAQHQLILWNHILNRVLELSDSNQDNKTEVEEILKLSNVILFESEVDELLMLGQPNKQLLKYLTGNTQGYEKEEVIVIWLETLNNLMMNNVYETPLDDLKCI